MTDKLDRILLAEELTLFKDGEIERVLNCCEQDHFSILEINPLVEPTTLQTRIKKIFRKKTLLLHPDKVSNVKAPMAFDRLKKSEIVLSVIIPEDENKISELDDETTSLVNEKQNLINIYKSIQDKSGEPIIDSFNHETNKQIRIKVSNILKDQIKQEEVDKKYQQRQEQQKQQEIKDLQLKRELKKNLENKWEDDRDIRVNNWRKYTNKVQKKKKSSKKKVLA